MPPTALAIKPVPAPRCTRHTRRKAGCLACQKRGSYQNRLAQWEKSQGLQVRRIPADRSREHLRYLVDEGNRAVLEIADISGYSDRTIQRILHGQQDMVWPLTEKSILMVGPAPAGRAPTRNLVPAVEGIRLLRGMFAQGWTWNRIAQAIGESASGAAACSIAHNRRNGIWMEHRIRERIRAAAAQLGPFDLKDLPAPIPGMIRRNETLAARYGWHKICAWKGLDIADPRADPSAAPLADLDVISPPDPADDGQLEPAFIDPVILKTIAETAERIRLGSTAADGRAGDLWIPPLRRIRQLELHAAWWYAEQDGLNDTQIGELFGYDMRDERSASFRAGQRQVNRVRARTLKSRSWFEQHPLGQIPAWFTKTTGRGNLDNVLPCLIALQPAPFGAGWSLEHLADVCGVPASEMSKFVAVATRKGDMPWNPQDHAPAKHRKRRTRRGNRRCSGTATRVAA